MCDSCASRRTWHLCLRWSFALSRPRRTRVYVVGYYGWGNFGDEIFKAVAKLNAEHFWGPGAKVRTFETPLPRLRTSKGFVGRVLRASEAVLGGLWAHRISLFGGSVLSWLTGTMKLRMTLFSERRVFEAIGVSIGPFRDAEAAQDVGGLLQYMDRVVVRDSKSVDRSPIAVKLGGDLAALYPMPQFAASTREGLTICPSVDSGVSPRDFASLLCKLLPEEGYHGITLLALNSRSPGGDVAYCQAISEELAAQGITADPEVFDDIERAVHRIAISKAVWAQRLHGLIVAYLSDVPVFVFSHHAKLADFAIDIGLDDDFVVEEAELTAANVNAAQTTLRGHRGWTLESTSYVQQTRKRFRVFDE